ncbi:MAG: ATP-binding protein [Nanoarchaeota archaeon]
MKDQDFVLNWLKEIGWHTDPFVPEICEPIDQFFAGYEKEREKLNLFILNNGSFGRVQGETSIGKTMLLKWLVHKLEKHKNNFMISYITKELYQNEKRFLDYLYLPFEAEHPIRSAMEKILGKKEKVTKLNIDKFLKERAKKRRYILIIDDAEELKQDDIDLLKRIKAIPNASIILAGQKKELDKLKLKELGKDELNVELKGLSFEAAKLMLKKRIEAVGGDDVWPFKDKILKDLFAMVDYNPGRVLKVCLEKAKELTVEIKIGKIKKEESKEETREVSFEQTEVQHTAVKPKHGILGIKFAIIDSEEEQTAKKEELKKKQEERKEERKDEKKEQKQAEEKTAKEKPKEDMKKEPALAITVKREEKKEEPEKESEGIVVDFGLVKNVDEIAKPKKQASPQELKEQKQHENLISAITKKMVKPAKETKEEKEHKSTQETGRRKKQRKR